MAACTAGEGQARRAAIEGRQPLFQDVGRGVHQAGVDVAELAQAEQVRRVLGVVKHVAGRGVDRHGPGGGGGIGRLAGVQCSRAESPENVLFLAHDFSVTPVVSGRWSVISGQGATCVPTVQGPRWRRKSSMRHRMAADVRGRTANFTV